MDRDPLLTPNPADKGAFVKEGLEVIHLGLVDYLEAQSFQLKKVEEVASGRAKEALIFCSHRPCVTTGRSTEPNEVAGWRGDLFEVSRGGRATYHGPEQMVVYPIIKLSKDRSGLRSKDLHHYLELLAQTTCEVLKSLYGLAAKSGPENPQKFDGNSKLHFTGVWVGDRKLASIGIAVKSWVSYHGLALNLRADPYAFQGLVPCGFSRDVMADLKSVVGEATVSRAEIELAWAKKFQDLLMGSGS